MEGLGDLVNTQYGIQSHITVLVVTPDKQIAGQFYGPDYFPTRDTLNNLLLSLGAQMQDCSVGISDSHILSNNFIDIQVSPNPVVENAHLEIKTKGNGFYHIKIMNIFGHVIQSFPTQLNKGINKIDVQLSLVPGGMYFISLYRGDEKLISKRILKQ